MATELDGEGTEFFHRNKNSIGRCCIWNLPQTAFAYQELFIIFNCACVFAHMKASSRGGWRHQTPLELELRVAVSSPTWVPGTALLFSQVS